jgi:hypothetical protein
MTFEVIAKLAILALTVVVLEAFFWPTTQIEYLRCRDRHGPLTCINLYWNN